MCLGYALFIRSDYVESGYPPALLPGLGLADRFVGCCLNMSLLFHWRELGRLVQHDLDFRYLLSRCPQEELAAHLLSSLHHAN
jgi:hypothetical protein